MEIRRISEITNDRVAHRGVRVTRPSSLGCTAFCSTAVGITFQHWRNPTEGCKSHTTNLTKCQRPSWLFTRRFSFGVPRGSTRNWRPDGRSEQRGTAMSRQEKRPEKCSWNMCITGKNDHAVAGILPHNTSWS